MLRFVLIIACIGLAHGLNVNNCAGGLPATREVEISGCTETPCYLERGGYVSGRIEFEAPFATATLVPRVLFTVGSGSGEFPMPPEFSNACDHLVGSECPLDATEDVTWKLTMPILEEYPPETFLILEISLVGDGNRVATCFEIPTVVI